MCFHLWNTNVYMHCVIEADKAIIILSWNPKRTRLKVYGWSRKKLISYEEQPHSQSSYLNTPGTIPESDMGDFSSYTLNFALELP